MSNEDRAILDAMPVITHYEVTNVITKTVKKYKTSARAIRAMNIADIAYGRSITTRKAIWNK